MRRLEFSLSHDRLPSPMDADRFSARSCDEWAFTRLALSELRLEERYTLLEEAFAAFFLEDKAPLFGIGLVADRCPTGYPFFISRERVASWLHSPDFVRFLKFALEYLHTDDATYEEATIVCDALRAELKRREGGAS